MREELREGLKGGRKDVRLRKRKERGKGRRVHLVVYVWCMRRFARVPLSSRSLRVKSKGWEKKRKKKKKETEIEEKRLMTGAVMIVVTTVVALLCVVAVVAVLHSWVVARQGLRQFRRDSCGMAHSIRCSLK